MPNKKGKKTIKKESNGHQPWGGRELVADSEGKRMKNQKENGNP